MTEARMLKDTLINDILSTLGKEVKPTSLSASKFRGYGLKLPIYYLPPGINVTLTERRVRKFLMALTLCGRSDEQDVSKWQSFVLTFAFLVLPELRAQVSSVGYVDYAFEEFPPAFEASIDAAIARQADEDTMGDTFINFPIGLPDASRVPFNEQHIEHCHMEAFTAYFSMMLFIFGKSAQRESVIALTSKRPKAIINRCAITKGTFYLVGDGYITPSNFGNIRSGFNKAVEPRISIFSFCAEMVTTPSLPEIYVPIQLNMKMLADSAQSYMGWCANVLIGCPWIVEIPVIVTELYAYKRMIDVLDKVNPTIRPYYKLMYQDADKELSRRKVPTLLACATVYAFQSTPSMAQYRISQAAMPMVTAFMDLAAKNGHKFQMSADQQTVEAAAV